MINLSITAINQAEPFNEICLDKTYWGISRKSFENLLPNMLSELTPDEIHSQSNGFGGAKYKFTGRVLDQTMVIYALFGGNGEDQLITFSMACDTTEGNEDIRAALTGLLGEPTNVNHVLYTTTWEEVNPELEINFRDFTSSFTISLAPADPFQYDDDSWDD